MHANLTHRIAIPIMAILTIVPGVMATDIGSPPDHLCEKIFTNIGGAVGNQIRIQGSDVDRNGNLFMAEQDDDGGTFHGGRLTKLNTTCQIVWSYTTGGTPASPDTVGCTGTSATVYCEVGPVAVDARNDVVAVVETTSAAFDPDNRWKLCRWDGQLGTVEICSDEFDDIPGLANQAPESSALAAIRVSDTAVAYLMGNGANVVRFDNNLAFEYITPITGTVYAIRADEQPGIAYVKAGSVNKRVDQADGTTLHTSTHTDDTQIDATVSRGQTGAFGMMSETTFVYFKLNSDTLATITDSTTLSPSNIGGVSTRVANWDADSADDILLCGHTDESGQNAFVARVDVALTSIAWARSFDITDASSTQTERKEDAACDFDYNGGFWVNGKTLDATSTAWARRYPSTGFIQPEPPALVTGEGGSTVPGGNLIETSRDNLASGFGITTKAAGWLLGLGLVGMVVWRVRDAAPLVIGILALIAVGLAIQVELLPIWLLLLIAFLIIAIAGGILFERNRRGDSE